MEKKLVAIAAIITIICSLASGLGVYYFMKPVPEEEVITTYTIGVAEPLSGPLASYGKSFRDAAALAIEDINNLMEKSGSLVRFRIVVADTETTAEGAYKAVRTLVETEGVEIMLGPLTTSGVLASKEYVDENHIVIIAHVSSGMTAAIPDDYIFRPIHPPDAYQGEALAKLVASRGYTKAAVLYRDDAYGMSISNEFKKKFEEEGGTVIAFMKYAPDQASYDSEVAMLSSEVAEAPPETTAVQLFAFEKEAYVIFSRAKDEPALRKVAWFGNEDLKSPTFYPPEATIDVANFLLETHFTVTSAYTPGNPLTAYFAPAFKKKFGYDPLPFSDGAYDCIWIIAQAILMAGYDGEALKEVIPTVSNHYIGNSVQTYLDENGDQAIAYFGLYSLIETDGAFEFKEIGYYDGSTGEIHFYAS